MMIVNVTINICKLTVARCVTRHGIIFFIYKTNVIRWNFLGFGVTYRCCASTNFHNNNISTIANKSKFLCKKMFCIELKMISRFLGNGWIGFGFYNRMVRNQFMHLYIYTFYINLKNCDGCVICTLNKSTLKCRYDPISFGSLLIFIKTQTRRNPRAIKTHFSHIRTELFYFSPATKRTQALRAREVALILGNTTEQ